MKRQSRHRVGALAAALAFAALVTAFAPAAAEGRGHYGHGFVGGHFHAVHVFPGFFGFSPFFSYPYFYDYYYGYGYPYPYPAPEGGIDRNYARLQGWGAVDLDIKPKKAEVWVDGEFVGKVGEFDGYPSYLWLKEGVHKVTVYEGGFESLERELSIKPGLVIRLKLKLKPGSSQPPSGEGS